MAIDEVLGSADDLQNLVKTFHSNNLSLILDIPIFPFIEKLEKVPTFIEESTKHPMIIDEGALRVARASSEKNTVIHAIALWMKCGKQVLIATVDCISFILYLLLFIFILFYRHRRLLHKRPRKHVRMCVYLFFFEFKEFGERYCNRSKN